MKNERQSALQTFKNNLNVGRDESWWQDFFERNKWIFGYGLNYKILKSVQIQPHYGGTNVTGKGAQRGDFLEHTEAEVRFTVLVEIKKPDSELLGKEEYRNGACERGHELTGGASPLQANCTKRAKEAAHTEG